MDKNEIDHAFQNLWNTIDENNAQVRRAKKARSRAVASIVSGSIILSAVIVALTKDAKK